MPGIDVVLPIRGHDGVHDGGGVAERRHAEEGHDAEEHGSELGGFSQLISFGDDRDQLGAGGFGALHHHSTGSLSHTSFSSPQLILRLGPWGRFGAWWSASVTSDRK